MKYIFLVTTMFIALYMGGCASKKSVATMKQTKAVKNLDLSKMIYPKKVGAYTLESKKSLENKNLGITLRYIDNTKTKAYLDCYIYPKGKDTDITVHYNELLSALKYMHKMGELKAFKVLSEESLMLDETHRAKRAVFEMANHNLPFYSVLYLSPLEDHYFKIRISNPHKAAFLKSDFGEKTVKELFKAIKFNK